MIFTIATSLSCPHGPGPTWLPRLSCCVVCCERLALVEKAPFHYPCLVFRGDLDVGRGQQEHLVGHALDAAVQPEDQACGEVDKALGVAVHHLREVHDHRRTVAEVLTDGTGLIVRSRVQSGDTRQIGCLGQRRGLAVVSVPAGVRTGLGRDELRVMTLGRLGQLVVLVGVLVVLLRAVLTVVAVVVAVVVLYEAEIDRHLAHRAGHSWSSVTLRCSDAHGVPRDGHYLTKSGRPPSNAVPIRRCVAPAATASSRSPLIPAEITVAAGCRARTCAATPASRANAGAAGRPSGATAITPPSTRPPSPGPAGPCAAIASASAGTSCGSAPPRAAGPAAGPGSSRLTWTRQVTVLLDVRQRAASASTRRIRSTECTTAA